MDEDAIAEALRERIAASAFHRGLGLEVEAASAGAVRLAMPARQDQLNLLGSVHGGVLATLADTAMGLAVRTAVGDGRRHTTIDMDVRFLRGAAPGRLVAEGTTIRVGQPDRGRGGADQRRRRDGGRPRERDLRRGAAPTISSRRRACPSRRRASRGCPASP